MDAGKSESKKILVIVDAPDALPEAHLDSCERMAGFTPVDQPRTGAQCSGCVAHLDEVREWFPSVLWCECMDEILESYLFAVNGRVGARLSFGAIRDENARTEVFAECTAQAISAILWADQDWQNRKPRPTS